LIKFADKSIIYYIIKHRCKYVITAGSDCVIVHNYQVTQQIIT